MKNRWLAILAIVASAALLIGCGEDAPLAPVAVAPTPEPTPTPDPACQPGSVIITAFVDAAGQRTVPVYAWGAGQIAILRATLVNRQLEQLPASCPRLDLLTTWRRTPGPHLCEFQGSTLTPDVHVKCLAGGALTVLAAQAGVQGEATFNVVSAESTARRR